jgi:hypothetical protein
MRVAALSCLLVALAASPVKGTTPASPLTFEGSLKTIPVLTWPQIQDGNGAFLIFNPSSDSIIVTTELRIVPEATEGPVTLRVKLTESEVKIESNEAHRFVIEADPQNPPAAGSYLATLVLKDKSGKTQPAQQRFKITVPPLSPLVTKLTVYAWRLAPIGRFSPWDSLTVAIPLNHRYTIYDSCSSLPVALRTDSGVIVTANYTCSASKTRELVIEKPWTTGKYEGDLTLGQYPEKIAVPLTIIAKDVVLYPIIVIIVGTYLAFRVKRYLGVLRIVWGLREQEAQLALDFRASQKKFEEIAAHQPFFELSIKDDVNDQLDKILQSIDQLEKSKATSISSTDHDYLSAVNGIQSLETAVAAWSDLAGALASLTQTVRSVQDLTSDSDFQPDPPVSPVVVQAAFALMEPQGVPTAKIASLNAQASTLQVLLVDWLNAFKRTLQLRDVFTQIPQNSAFTEDQKALMKSLQQEFETLPTQFWAVAKPSDMAQLAGFGGVLNTIAGQLAQLQAAPPPRMATVQSLTRTAGLAWLTPKEVSKYASFLPEKTSALRLDADPSHRVAQLRAAIWRSDLATTVFAGTVGLLTGLNTFYIGKPFGSLGDYVSLFLWAAGTKAALDILLGVIDKFGSIPSK